MLRRLFRLIAGSVARASTERPPAFSFATNDIVWAMGSFCALNQKPFDAEILLKQFPPPYTADTFIHVARALGFRIQRRICNSSALSRFSLPCLAILRAMEPVHASNDPGAAPLDAAATPRANRPAI